MKKKNDRHLYLELLRAVIYICCSSAVSFAVAADYDELKALHEKYSYAEIQQAIEEFTYSSDSRTGMEAVPLPIIYRTAFIQILHDESILENNFSESDVNIINSLPDHNDLYFRQINYKNTAEACTKVLDIGGGHSRNKAAEMALAYQELDYQANHVFEDHYAKVIKSLSAGGQKAVEDTVNEISSTTNFTNSTVDLVGLSSVLPEYVELVTKHGCLSFQSQPDPSLEATSEARLLKDAPKYRVQLENN